MAIVISEHCDNCMRFHEDIRECPVMLQGIIDDLFDYQIRLKEALQWCGGNEDFQMEGKARKGWEELCMPLLKGEEDD